MLTSDVVLDEVTGAFAGQRPTPLSTHLSTEQDEALRTAFVE